MMNSTTIISRIKRDAFWYICLALILFFSGWGLNVLTSRIDYKWYWNRIPQYFVFSGDFDVYASGEGDAVIHDLDKNSSQVVLKYLDGTSETVTVKTDSLEIKNADPVTAASKIGTQKGIRLGILTQGLIVTLKISIYSGVLGLVIGLFAGLGRVAKNPLIRSLTAIYVELVRGTPLLVQIFIFYFFLGTILQLGRFTTGLMALTIFVGAYVAEIIRSGIQSINPGQMEAARSLGLNYIQAMSYVLLPQAFRRTLPPLAGQFISLIKDSSLVSVIAITDLTKAGREVITSTFATFEIWFTVAGLYLVLTFTLSMVVSYIERRYTVSD